MWSKELIKDTCLALGMGPTSAGFVAGAGGGVCQVSSITFSSVIVLSLSINNHADDRHGAMHIPRDQRGNRRQEREVNILLFPTDKKRKSISILMLQRLLFMTNGCLQPHEANGKHMEDTGCARLLPGWCGYRMAPSDQLGLATGTRYCSSRTHTA